nr:hypothetical protein [Nocardia bovistercoris]
MIFGGIPLVVYGAIAGLSYLGKPFAGEKPTHFDLGQKWTQPPVLWSATDEVIGHGHHGGDGHGGHAAIEADLIGGRASGKF